MTEKPPSELFRAISANSEKDLDEIYNSHYDGRLWFHAPAHYQNIEDLQRQDELEGRGSYHLDGVEVCDVSDPKRGWHVCPAYILCFSADEAAASACFAEPETPMMIIRLANPEELRSRILERVLPDCNVINVEWREVVYDKTEDVPEDLNPAADRARKFWHKPKRFAVQKEWRLIVFFRHSMPIANDRLELHLGNCGSLFRPHKT